MTSEKRSVSIDIQVLSSTLTMTLDNFRVMRGSNIKEA